MTHTYSYYIYILASKKNGVLYIGVTGNLLRRVYEHKHNLCKGFTRTYNVHRLVYFEETEDVYAAIQREKQLKKWKREWKIKLISELNPEWNDLYYEYGGKEFDEAMAEKGAELEVLPHLFDNEHSRNNE